MKLLSFENVEVYALASPEAFENYVAVRICGEPSDSDEENLAAGRAFPYNAFGRIAAAKHGRLLALKNKG